MSDHEPRREPPPAGPAGQIEADRLLIARYLEGETGSLREVDRWIRAELGFRFPVLRLESQDLAQAIHGQLLEAFRAGRFQHRCALKTYVVRITRYNAVDCLRRLRRDRLFEDAALLQGAIAGDGPYLHLVARERSETLRNIVMLAPRTCRQLWSLAFVDGLGFREIAARLSIPEGTVKSRMWYCRRRAFALLRRLHQGGAAPGERA